MAKYCQDCGSVLSNPHKCSCGWIDTGNLKSKKSFKSAPDYRCKFEYMAQRCKRVGTISPATKQGGDKGDDFHASWYCCRSHMEHDHSKPPRDKPARDWRDELTDADKKKHGIQYAPKTKEEKREYLKYTLECMSRHTRPKEELFYDETE